ncbi:MAG: leucine-rich repeat protein, partial [Clostridia bacterium]|nr:leucine-rich repeat protein [Clostridia bacterium]
DVYYNASVDEWTNNVEFGVRNNPLFCAAVHCSNGDVEIVPSDIAGDENTVACGVCGRRAWWKFDKAGALTIGGSGDMFLYYGFVHDLDEDGNELETGSSDIPWFGYADGIVSGAVGEGIEYITAGTFELCGSLEKVSIPSSVRMIENYAFDGCGSLADVYYAGTGADWEKIEIGDEFNDALFDAAVHCSDGDYEADPDLSGDESIVAFGRCGNRARWTLDVNGTLTIAGAGEMYGYNAVEDPMSRELWDETEIPWAAWAGNIRSAVIEKGILNVANGAFDGCTGLRSVEIAPTVRRLGIRSFADTALTEVTIPADLWQIDYEAFDNCGSLRTVYYLGDILYWYYIVSIDPGNDPLTDAMIFCLERPAVPSTADAAFYIDAPMTVAPGEVFTVTLRGFWNEPLAQDGKAILTLYAFDDEASYVPLSLEVNDGIDGLRARYNAVSGRLTLNYSGEEPLKEDSALVTLSFRAKRGYEGDIHFSLIEDSVWFYSEDFPDVFTSGAVVASTASLPAADPSGDDAAPGDADLDGTVTAADARLALRQAVRLEALSEAAFAAADVDRDGEVTPADARAILRHVVGLEQLEPSGA